MNTLKKLLKAYFQYFYYFYSHLRYRIFISLTLSLFVGIMDGLGLAMFIPLLQMVDTNSPSKGGENMGNMSFIVDIFNYFGISLTLNVVLAIIFVFFTIKGILKFSEGYARIIYEQLFIRIIRSRNISGLSNFSYNVFVNSDIGRIQNTFSGEVEKVNQAYRYYFFSFQYGIFVFVYISMAFFTNPRFAIFVAIGGFLTNLIFRRLHKLTKSISKKITIDSHTFQSLIIQKVSFFKYLKSTGLIHKYANKLLQANDKIQDSQKRAGLISAILGSVREPLTILVVVLVILIQVNYYSMSVAAIILSLLLFYRGLVSLMSTQSYWNLFLGVSGSLTNMSQFNEELKAGKEKVGTTPFKGFSDKLVLNDVSFYYEDTSILDSISLSIKKNETIAIVGESGSGKTTLLNVLTGLIKPLKGSVLIDSKDLEILNKEAFQQRIGYITQEPVIFNDTIFNNVTFWDSPTPENKKRLNEALEKASILDFVKDQPLQEEAMLGNNGINVSGGQKQRLSIARELYKEVDFLFMDEATSALDSETEKLIQENIEKLRGKYTIIIIAHRLSTIKDVDRIILLNKGRVQDTGTFEELLSKSTSFRKMVDLQAF